MQRVGLQVFAMQRVGPQMLATGIKGWSLEIIKEFQVVVNVCNSGL